MIYFFTKGEKNWLELLELADRAIECLPFHQHLPIIKECVHICSYLYDKNHCFFTFVFCSTYTLSILMLIKVLLVVCDQVEI